MFPTRRITLGGDKFRDEYSLAFDGTNDYIDCGSDSSLDAGTTQFTVTCWFKLSADADMQLFGKGKAWQSTVAGWTVGHYADTDKIWFHLADGTNQAQVISSAVSQSTWYHLAVRRKTNGSASDYSIYIDGIHHNTTNDNVNFSA